MINACEVCGIECGYRQPCESPSCPCYRTACCTPEMERAASAWRSRPSVAAARTSDGEAALEHLEMRAWLELWGAVIEVEHRRRGSRWPGSFSGTWRPTPVISHVRWVRCLSVTLVLSSVLAYWASCLYI